MADDEIRPEKPAPEQMAEDSVIDAEIADIENRAELPPVASAPVRRHGGGGAFVGLVTGGVVAAAMGFGLARAIPGGWPVADTTALESRIAAQDVALAALKSDLAALAARPLPDATAQIADLRTALEAQMSSAPVADPGPAIAAATANIDAALTALDARLTAVEKQPVGTGGGASATALAAYDRELQTLRDQIAAQSGAGADLAAQIESVAAEAKTQLATAAGEAARLKAESAAAARSATIGAAIVRIRAALEAGGPFGAALADLTGAGIEVPASLSGLAEAGIPSLTDLQRTFPDAARAALDAGLRSSVGETWGDRLTAFLRTQTGARSLQPREGNDPDAILSRAEAAVQDGHIAQALTELGALPDVAKAPLAAWIADAQAREAASAAIAALGDVK